MLFTSWWSVCAELTLIKIILKLIKMKEALIWKQGGVKNVLFSKHILN